MRSILPYNLVRVMGITTLFLIVYIVVIGIFGNVDISPLLPKRFAASLQSTWPELPFFNVQKQTLADGNGVEVYYTVPTRQLTPQEIALISKGKPRPTGQKPAATAAEAKATSSSAQ